MKSLDDAIADNDIERSIGQIQFVKALNVAQLEINIAVPECVLNKAQRNSTNTSHPLV